MRLADLARRLGGSIAAERAIEMYGHIDTWVNNAGNALPGHLGTMTIAEARRMFDVSYWGMVYGSLVAVQHMRVRGGTIVNVGDSAGVGRTGLDQGHACATRQAVKSFTDTLRVELGAERLPIHVTLVKPGVPTGGERARGRSPWLEMLALEPPNRGAQLVASAVVTCAQRPMREVAVGGPGRVRAALASVVPQLQRRLLQAPLEPRLRDRSLALHSVLAAGNLLAFGVGMHLVDRARSRALDL